jgi:REP element-mobilizing transposase RayT
LLDAPARAVVVEAIRDQCIHAGWELHALHVRTNHLHVVISGSGAPVTMMSRLKSWATRRLREAKLIDDSQRVWARHGSTVPLRTAEAAEAACRYVVEHQGLPI